jgi:hypothetical protein
MSTYSYVRVPPDGAGKRIYTTEHVVSGNTVQVQGINLVSGDDPTHILNVDSRGSIITKFRDGDPLISSYGDLKLSQDSIIGVYEHTVDAYDDLFYTELLSGGTSTYEPNEASVVLAVTNESGSKSRRITNRFHYYQPGISMLVIITTSCGDSGKANNRRQWGYFTPHYGLFFELSGTTINVVRRSNITGSVVDEVIPQSSWNIDKFDGTGNSGLILDVTKAYQYFINVNYPDGLVSFGLYDAQYGRLSCHKLYNSGVLAYPHIKHMNLPISFVNENIGMTGGVSELREIMAVVKSESRDPNYTFWRFGDLGCVNKAVTTNTPVLSVRPKTLLDNGRDNHINSYPETLSVYSTGSTIKIMLVSHDGTILTGSTWGLDSVGGPLQADSGATSIDVNSDQYWIQKTFYVENGKPTNIDLTPMYELNDEGILMSGDGVTQACLSIVASCLGGSSANVSMDLSYRGLY